MNNDLHKMLRKSIHRNNKGKANMDYIDVNAINKEVFPDQTPQMAKDQLKRKLYGESINEIGDTPKGQYALGKVAGRARGRIDNRKKGEFSRKDIRKFKETEGYASGNPTDNFQDGYWDAYNNEYYKRYGNPYEKWNESKNMNKKLIRLTENDLRNIVKGAVNKILKEGYYDDLHDSWGQEDEQQLTCPYCESDNVQSVMGKNGSWDGSCRCYDCGKIFDIDSARGNNYFEPDWSAMRHESHKRNNKILKEGGNGATEIRWGKYERLVDQIRNATQELYMTTSNQDANTPSYDETEGRLHRFAEGVLSVLEEFDFVDYGFDPTQHITW